MSISTALIGIIRNSPFVRRDKGYPENEEPDTVNTLEDIVRQVQLDAAESQKPHDVNEFFSPAHGMAGKAPNAPVAPVNLNAAAGPGKEKAMRHLRLTADQYEALIEKDLTVLEIIGKVMDRNLAARSRLKTRPS